MKKILKRLATGFLAFATTVTALPTTAVHASEKQYWTESAERVGIVEKVMNDGSIGSTFNEGHMTVEGEDAFCVDINTNFRNGYKTRADASTRMSYDQISDVALSIEYVNQYVQSHRGLSSQHIYLLKQCVVWQRLSVHLGWQCDNVRASYDEIPKAIQDEVYAGAKAFASENKGRYECGGYIYSGEGQDIGQFWAKLAVGNATLKKVSSNASITDGNGLYSIAGATYGVYSDKDCTKQLATLTTDNSGNTDTVEVKAGTVYIKELFAPAGYKVDSTVYSLNVEAGKTATLNVSDTPKVTDTLIELFKIDMETQKDAPQGDASLEGAEFTWEFYAGHYTADNLPSEPTKTWVTKTIAEKDSDGTIHYVSRLSDEYKVSGDSFYKQDGKNVLPLGTLTVEETKAPNGYLLDGAYMQANGSEEQIKGMYLTQITEDGDNAVLSGSNQYHVSDKVIRGGVKVQKRDLETSDTKGQGSATLKDAEFEIISLNDNAVLVEGKLYNKGEVVKTILTDIEGVASTSADLLPYGKYRIEESKAPEGYLTDGAEPIEFEITEDGKIVDLTGADTSIYNQVKRGDLEGVKIGAGTHQRLAGVTFRITSKTTGESHIIVTDDNGQFSTSSDWASHKHNTNAGKTSEDGIWFGVYKNFTAIDQHTTHEVETIQLRLNDTNGIENFVKNFCKSYYTWSNSKEAIEARTQAISAYLTQELQDLNVDTVRTDIPTSSTVTDVLIWDVEQSGENAFSVTYEVDQQIKEGDQTRNVSETYTVTVHVDADGDMVIIQNPTLAPAMEKSDYEPKAQEADNSVDADTAGDATAFLETFFKLYPTATDKELAYYVEGNALEPINGDYLFSELVNPVFTKDGDNVKVKVSVKFIDNQTKATQVSQYELTLHKDSNWKIIG